MEWKYGHWGKRNYVRTHKIIISKVQQSWNEFVELNDFAVESIFSFWRQKLIEHQNFITIAFLAHLIHNPTVQIIDQHTFRAMNYLLSDVRPAWLYKRKPSDLEDLRTYNEFFEAILSSLDFLEEDSDRRRKLDKFFMMFGKYKAANIDKSKIRRKRKGKTVQFDWSSLTSRIFDLDRISLNANADALFVHLLLSLEKEYEEDIPETITIREISHRIPLGTAGISNYSSYNYAMIALFGGQRGRDYFQFEDPTIRDLFTEQANNPLRDNNFWKEYMDERVTINPKYIL